MARRTMTLRRIDPWSVLKFGFVLNLCFLAVMLLGVLIIWFVIRQLGIIEQVCELLLDVGFEDCGVNGGNLFRVVLLLGVLGTVIMTGLAVFGAFLHNLLADLVGGITFSVNEAGTRSTPLGTTGERTRRSQEPGRSADGPSRTESLGTPPPPGRDDASTGAEASAGGDTRDVGRGDAARHEGGDPRGASGSAQGATGTGQVGSEERPSWTPSSSSGGERLFGGEAAGGAGER